MAQKRPKTPEPTIVNRRARHDYHIGDTLEVGIKLTGTEVKSVRAGRASLQEGYVRAEEHPPNLVLHGVHIAEYDPAGPFQHKTTRSRTLLAHKREIVKLAQQSTVKGTTIVPLKLYFKEGRIKLQIGLGKGKQRHDKRQDIRKREAERDIQRAMSRRM